MRIGEIAARAGVNVQTLRYYERRGFLSQSQRLTSGYRSYDADTARQVRFIKRAQELGFTLQEITELLALRDPSSRHGIEVRNLAAGKLQDIECRIRQLTAMRQALADLVEACDCERGAGTCPIIEALDGT